MAAKWVKDINRERCFELAALTLLTVGLSSLHKVLNVWFLTNYSGTGSHLPSLRLAHPNR